MKILGVHDGHNASACLLEEGQIEYCIQEERLTNTKNYFGFPFKSIKKILTLANIAAEGLDFVAMASHHTANEFEPLLKMHEDRLGRGDASGKIIKFIQKVFSEMRER